MTVQVRPTGDGAAFTVHCRPRSQASRCRRGNGSALRLDIAAPPERGLANDEVVRLLARALAVPRAALRISAGTAGREKSIRVLGMTCAELKARLDRIEAHADP